ncbi:MAG: LPS export ABC transporter ATP-binding protein [Candidatus Acetothermia bacterium]|jgi:lipopolysaccharide export system ATP-binding protein|nr:LPS export ABC transporter ATP-binding protein [Candidatus Acetothermia bacterium]MDH7505356.1 LPS export ABC transporter ATP-binding protein [Candidatus Acetothermia bacterium]
MLEAEELVKSYSGRRVVDRVSLSISPGKVFGLLGPNGAGKTTTFQMIIGLIAPEGGRLILNGEEVTRLPFHERARRGINYLPQEPSVFRKLSVKQNLLVVLEALDAGPRAREARVAELLAKFELLPFARRRADSLSAGERRRVEIARALATSPSFLLLDEPFSGIDPLSCEEIQRLILSLRDEGLGIIVTDHNVHETLKVTDYAYLINQGKILLSGPPQEVAADPLAKKFYLGERFRY